MADTVESVAPFLAAQMLATTVQSPKIKWLTKPRMVGKIVLAPLRRRNLFA